MIVIGAGLAGLLAGAILRDRCSAIVEAQTELPNNHAAILRFRSSIVGDTLNIPFKCVDMIKAVDRWRNPIADAMAYSKKTNGGYHMRSVLTANGNIQQRYISPPDLIQRMYNCLNAPVSFGFKVAPDFFDGRAIISTIPMPVLMKLLNYEGQLPSFTFFNGQTITATVEGADAYCSLYVPNPQFHFYRLSLTGNALYIEYANDLKLEPELEIQQAAYKLGLARDRITDVKVRPQQYSKILPINETTRRKFVIWATEKHNVYSLGRFAVWRPGLLLDDLVQDMRIIQNIASSSNYEHHKGAK
jgi:hypothetical protein